MMLFVGGARLRHLVVTGVVSMGGLAYLIFGTAYRRARFLSFFDPWKDPLSHGYQLIQGLIALGSGGWFGVGLGASRQKWAYLPNAHTDFIFAVLGEELGLLGEFVVLDPVRGDDLRGDPDRGPRPRHVRTAAGGRASRRGSDCRRS